MPLVAAGYNGNVFTALRFVIRFFHLMNKSLSDERRSEIVTMQSNHSRSFVSQLSTKSCGAKKNRQRVRNGAFTHGAGAGGRFGVAMREVGLRTRWQASIHVLRTDGEALCAPKR